jgi:apoptotic chromatin condensation inducer in the nucleus
LHSDHENSAAVAVAEPEDDTSKKMIIDDVPSGLTDTNVELGAKVDCKIEQEEVSTLFDATALHAYPKERIVAAAKGLVVGTAEASQRSLDVVAEVEYSLVDTAATDETNANSPDSTSSGNTIVKEANPHSEGHGDTIEIKLEDEPAPPDDMLHSDHEDSDAVAVAEPEDDTSKKMIIDDVLSGPTHTNVELGAKVDCKIEQEEVSILSDATALHAYPKEHIVAAAKGLALPRRTLMSGYTSDIDLDRKEESPDRNSREKLNLDRSSGDESMDEDVMESKHADSYIKPDDLIGKTEVTSEHVFKEVSLLDTHAEGSSAHSKEVVTEEKPPTPTEKRKPEG